MKYIALLLAIFLIGCQGDSQGGSQEERQLDVKFEQVNKVIEQYAGWVIAMGEKMEKPRSGIMYGSGDSCFFWDLGPHGRAYILKNMNDSRRQIYIGYRESSKNDIPDSCCDLLPYTDSQKERVDRLYQKWEQWEALEAKRSKYDNLNKLKERLQRLIPKETE